MGNHYSACNPQLTPEEIEELIKRNKSLLDYIVGLNQEIKRLT